MAECNICGKDFGGPYLQFVHKAYHLSCLVERVQQQQAEIERLQAIVQELPKTADGVPVVPGMVLHKPGSVWKVETALMLKGGSQPTRGDSWLQLSTGHYYSTREAAEVKEE